MAPRLLDGHVRRKEKLTRDWFKSSLPTDDHQESLKIISSMAQSELSCSGERGMSDLPHNNSESWVDGQAESPAQRSTNIGSVDRLQLSQVQRRNLHPILEADKKLGRPRRVAGFLPRSLASSTVPPFTSNYAGSQTGAPNNFAQGSSMAGGGDSLPGFAQLYPSQPAPAGGAQPAPTGGGQAAPAGGGQASPSGGAQASPAGRAQPPTPSSTGAVNQPAGGDQPAPPALAPQSADDDQPTPTPAAHQSFNLINSSLVVAVPSHLPQTNSPAMSPAAAAGSSQATHGSHNHKKEGSSGGLSTTIAIVMPILLVFLGAALIAHRVIRRRRRSAANRVSGDGQLIISGSYEGHQHQMENVAEKDRFSSYLKSPYAMDDELNNFGLRRESRLCPPLPLLAIPSPAAPNSPLVNHNNFTFNADPGNTTAESSATGGVPCRMNCVVARTFAPTMSDELIIGIGDRVMVYMLFDDGWCLGENLDFDKHEVPEGYSRTGVLPQDCLSGLNRTTMTETETSEGSGVALSWRTAGEETSHMPSCQEILSTPHSHPHLEILSHPEPEPLDKPERNSSLLCDREAQLFLELDHALAFDT